MTRAITIIAMSCFLIVGTAAISILGRDSVPAARSELSAPVVESPVANRESKQDRLAVAKLALASLEPPQMAAVSEPPWMAYAAAAPSDVEPAKAAPVVAPPWPAPPKPKLVAKPVPQKSYALLSDVQIAGIKERLKLSPEQESYWPAVETALRAVARKIHATRQGDPKAAGVPPIDPDAEEVQQLKSAAMPLLFQLREDQKQEVRTLARLIGLEKVASAI